MREGESERAKKKIRFVGRRRRGFLVRLAVVMVFLGSRGDGDGVSGFIERRGWSLPAAMVLKMMKFEYDCCNGVE
ncbi:hypothetical protein Dsin_004075 [Dipteronia sinensis]|uniref:Uncharacterized protein n=1 Tax=Dipteronia sinensis TaxID=43782 RepID=A0AAE0EL96_9ROSI|nr:hypothetical protein Dsin_004075 [Dipteronia sinensis]